MTDELVENVAREIYESWVATDDRDIREPSMSALARAALSAVEAAGFVIVPKDPTPYMQAAVMELQRVHRLSERDAASIVITITSVVSLGPRAARPKQENGT